MVARLLNLDINIKNVNFRAKEHLSEEFVKLNPLSKVPVLTDDDGNFVLTESQAIMGYLVNKFKPNDPLYPFDPKKRAKIDQRLYYDATAFFPANAVPVVSKILKI
jgi:glutathione S-transferase